MARSTAHAETVSSLVDALMHLSKAKIVMDSGKVGEMFGDEYAATVATVRVQVNDNLVALASGIQQVLENEVEERSAGVQLSLTGVTPDDLQAQREKKKRRKEGATEPKVALRPIYRLFRFKPTEETFAVRFYPTEQGEHATGMKMIEDYSKDERSLDEQLEGLPLLEYDANPELLEWLDRDVTDFEAIPGAIYPPPEVPAAAGPEPEKTEEPTAADSDGTAS